MRTLPPPPPPHLHGVTKFSNTSRVPRSETTPQGNGLQVADWLKEEGWTANLPWSRMKLRSAVLILAIAAAISLLSGKFLTANLEPSLAGKARLTISGSADKRKGKRAAHKTVE